MQTRPVSQIRVQQCLFGYDDGHRELASSIELPPSVKSTLLFLSDLAPGLTNFPENGYWTGTPMLGFEHYALLRTWAASEKRRPGSVWTHVVLVPFGDLAKLEDLGLLRTLFFRPDRGDLNHYRKVLSLDPGLDGGISRRYSIATSEARVFFDAVYGGAAPRIIEGQIGEHDDLLFAMWSQQWPRLRQAFSFRTAGVESIRNPSSIRFTVQIVTPKTATK